MTTTLEMLQKSNRLKVYETLEIKRQYTAGYESSWLDITSYLLMTNATQVSQKLDFESNGYGQFKTGNATFTLDNSLGAFNDENDIYSLFISTISRHMTKVRYKAGYRDETDTKIDEVTFQGLVNEKLITTDYNTGTMTMTALAYEMVMSERTIEESAMDVSMTVKEVVARIMTDTTITAYLTYAAGNINPGRNITFDNARVFEKRKVSDVLTDICKKTNSVWYIDANQALIMRDRTVNAGTAFAFVGGSNPNRNCNILADGIIQFDPGYTRIINEVKYTSGSTVYTKQASAANLLRYGTTQLPLTGEDITTPATIDTLSGDILTDNQTPKWALIVRTYYMPNVIAFFGPCTIDYKPKLKTRMNAPALIYNNSMNYNDGNYYGQYQNRLILTTEWSYKYYGYLHNVAAGYTDHYLVRTA